MALPKGIMNLANDFYNGATKGAKKASWTVNKTAKKNRMVQNLDVTKTINKSKKAVNDIKTHYKAPDMDVKIRTNNNINRIPRKTPFVQKPSAAAQAGNFAGGGIRDSIGEFKKMPDGEKSIWGAIQDGHKKRDKTGKLTENYDMGKIAGTTFSVGVAGRIATGGGLYRDKNGNFNLPGIPFI